MAEEELGSASVTIQATLDQLRRDLAQARSMTERAEEELSAQGRLTVDNTGVRTGVASAERMVAGADLSAEGRVTVDTGSARSAGNEAGRAFTGAFGGSLSGLKSITAGAMKGLGGGFAALGAAQAASGVAALASALAPAVGLLGVVPGAAAGAAAGLAAIKIGTVGMGDALKEAFAPTVDAEKLNAALARLSPQARGFVTALQGMRPAFDGMRLGVQDALFAGLGAKMQQLGAAYMPVLKTGLSGIAGGFNLAATNLSSFLLRGQSVADVGLILQTTSTATRGLAGAAAPIAQIFLDIATVGAGFLPGLANGFTGAATSAAAFVRNARESGRLAEWIQGGFDALSTLGTMIRDVGTRLRDAFNTPFAQGLIDGVKQISVLGGALTPTITAAAGLLAVLGPAKALLVLFAPALAQIAAAAAPAIDAFLQGLLPAMQALQPAMLPLGQAIGGIFTALTPLLPVIGQVAGLLAGALAQAIVALTPAIAPIVQAFLAFVQAIMPLLPLIGQMIGTLLPPLAQMFTLLMTALAPVIQAFVTALQPVLPIIAQAFTTILNALTPLLPVIGDALIQIIQALVPLIGPLVELFAAVVTALLPLLPALLPIIVKFAELAGDVLPPLIKVLTWIAENVLPLVIRFIGWLIEKLAGLPNPVSMVIDAFRRIGETWTSIKQQAQALADLLGRSWDWIKGKAADLKNWVVGKWNELKDSVTNAVQQLRDGVSSRFQALVDYVSGIPGRIVGFFANLGRDLYNAGRNILQGLIDGIVSKAQGAYDAVLNILRWIRDLLPFSPAKEGPFSGRGWTVNSGQALIEGLAAGIRSRQSDVVKAAEAVTKAAAAALDPAAVGLATGRFSARGSMAMSLPNVSGDLDARLPRAAQPVSRETADDSGPTRLHRDDLLFLADRIGTATARGLNDVSTTAAVRTGRR